MYATIAAIIGGLSLFIYAITQLSVVLREAFTERAKSIISGYTRNLFMAIVLGTVITVLMGSSSAVIILAIIFVNAGGLTFKQAMGIVMGANIGTTFSSQIIALDIGLFAPLLMAVGLVLSVIRPKTKTAGKVTLFLGMLFFGLFIIEGALEPLQDSEVFVEWLQRLENPVQGALIGGLVTLIIQSSSATVGLAITLGKQQMIDLSAGIAVMLGAELGTCSDTLIATLGGTRAGIRTGVWHLFFNLTTIVLGLILFHPFVQLVENVSGESGLYRQIANAHMIFNVSGVLIFVPFVGIIERLLLRLIPDRRQKTID